MQDFGVPSNQIGAKSAVFPPRMGQGGTASGRPNRRGGTPKSCKVPESGSKKGGTPILGTFLRFWGISGENGVQSWPPRESKPAEKTIHHPWGVISEVLPRVGFTLPACPWPKYTVGRTSEMTPHGWCTVFSAGLASLGGQKCTPFSPKIPRNGQNGPKSPQKGGTPIFCTLFILYLYNF